MLNMKIPPGLEIDRYFIYHEWKPFPATKIGVITYCPALLVYFRSEGYINGNGKRARHYDRNLVKQSDCVLPLNITKHNAAQLKSR
jgi:hypothetical protein